MKSYDVTKRGVTMMIDIEEELEKAQVRYILKELEQLRFFIMT